MNKLLKGLFVFVLVVLFAVSANAKDWSAWILGNDTSLSIRTGYNVSNKAEIGIETCWLEGNKVPRVWAAYATYKPIGDVNVPNPLPLFGLPETLVGTSYIGVQTGLNLDNQGTFVGPTAGIVIGKILVVEYQYTLADFDLKNVDNKQSVLVGLRFEF